MWNAAVCVLVILAKAKDKLIGNALMIQSSAMSAYKFWRNWLRMRKKLHNLSRNYHTYSKDLLIMLEAPVSELCNQNHKLQDQKNWAANQKESQIHHKLQYVKPYN